MDVELADHRADRGQILLLLRPHVGALNGSPAVQARRRHGHVVGLVHLRWHAAPVVATVGCAGLAPRSARVTLRRPLGEWGRLTETCSPRGVQLVPQPLVLAPEPIAVLLQARAVRLGTIPLLSKPTDFFSEVVDDFLRGAR